MGLSNGVCVKSRDLPHWHKEMCVQFITFHLADSLPKKIRDSIEEEKAIFLNNNPIPWDKATTKLYHSTFTTRINEYLDAGYGNCWLKKDECADVMEQALWFFNEQRYRLLHYVVMPNHVHVLVEVYADFSISDIEHSWKTFSARNINRIIGLKGKLWHHESWDRLIRDKRHYYNVLDYIEHNIDCAGVRWMQLP